MKIAVMQPYLFPYLGYFQLIHAVDAFVFYDDVNFIKGGWINRNYILGGNGKQLMTLPLKGASPNKLINEIVIDERHKITKTLRQNYSKAPYFDEVFPMIEKIMLQSQTNLAAFLDHQLRHVCQYLGVSPQWHLSSDLRKDNQLRGQDKVLAICHEFGASHYINAPGGRALYDREAFDKNDLKLSIIQPRSVSYRQFGNDFVPNLSIIDVLMFNSRADVTKLLSEYDFV